MTKKWIRIGSIATGLALTATLLFNLLLPVTIKPRIGYLSFGISTVKAASINTLNFYSGWELNSVFLEFSGFTGSPSIDSTIKHTGSYSMRSDGSGAESVDAGLSDGAMDRVTFYLYVDTNVGADALILGDSSGAALYLTTSREIDYYTAGVKRSDGTTVLTIDTWYRISASTNGSTFKVFINGTEEISNGTTVDEISTGEIGKVTSTTGELNFDNLAFDNTSSIVDLGDVRVQRSMPKENGTYGEYDQTSGYTYVNAWPYSDATYVEDNGSDAARDSYGIQETTDLSIDAGGDIHGVTIWIRGDRDGGGSTDHKITVRDSGTDYESAALSFNSGTPSWFSWYHNDLPNGGGDWTVARFNALEIGAYHLGGQDQRVQSILGMVAYSQAAGGTPDISNTPASKAFGVVSPSSTNWSNGSEPTWPLVDGDAFFTVTNNSSGAVSITLKATNFTGGVGWTLTSGTPGSNTVKITAFEEGDGSGDGLVLTTSEQAFIAALAASANKDWEFKLETGTFTDGAEKTNTLTLTATLD